MGCNTLYENQGYLEIIVMSRNTSGRSSGKEYSNFEG